jgi:hypothetical protein
MENGKHQTVSFRIGVERLQNIDHFCDECDITRSQLIRKLISSFKPAQKHQQTERAISDHR